MTELARWWMEPSLRAAVYTGGFILATASLVLTIRSIVIDWRMRRNLPAEMARRLTSTTVEVDLLESGVPATLSALAIGCAQRLSDAEQRAALAKLSGSRSTEFVWEMARDAARLKEQQRYADPTSSGARVV